jgi:KipI family sensor histidine kinase inhibitor
VTVAEIQFEAIAEDALLLRFGTRIELALNDRVQAATARLRRQLPQLECVPAYASVLLRFDALAWLDHDDTDPAADEQNAVDQPAHRPPHRLLTAVRAALEAHDDCRATVAHEHSIPVCYGGEYGPDLAAVARHCRLDTAAVIARHTAAEYHVAMLGFAPGFPYLLGLDPQLAMPRRADPRQRVPAGSVAIGGSQTGIYPQALPGGWQVIGRTPTRLFDISTTAPALLAAGDRVRFRIIDAATFRRLESDAPPCA